ncbi:hypothetical protein RI367_003360 [Sorochytrium milnesiophthora]
MHSLLLALLALLHVLAQARPVAQLLSPFGTPLPGRGPLLELLGADTRIQPGPSAADLQIHTRTTVFSRTQSLALHAVGDIASAATSATSASQRAWFYYISAYFGRRADNSTTAVQVGDQQVSLTLPAKSGESVTNVQLSPSANLSTVITPQSVAFSPSAPPIQLMANGNNSSVPFSIISDIDDTIRHTEVLDKRRALENTFINPFQPTDHFPAFYATLQQSLQLPTSSSGAGADVSFHYVSGGPVQLATPLQEWLRNESYPSGSLALRNLNPLVSTDFWTGTQGFKVATITRLMQRYPGRRWVLIGDSGEVDPETYGKVYAAAPPAVQDNIRCIYIRKVTGTNAAKEAVKNTDQRFQQALGQVPKAKWATFFDPREVQGADIQGGKCTL